MDDYYVSYTICDGAGRGAVGSGSVVMRIAAAPRDTAEVDDLAHRITSFNQSEGRLHGQYVTVNSWSKMGA